MQFTIMQPVAICVQETKIDYKFAGIRMAMIKVKTNKPVFYVKDEYTRNNVTSRSIGVLDGLTPAKTLAIPVLWQNILYVDIQEYSSFSLSFMGMTEVTSLNDRPDTNTLLRLIYKQQDNIYVKGAAILPVEVVDKKGAFESLLYGVKTTKVYNIYSTDRVLDNKALRFKYYSNPEEDAIEASITTDPEPYAMIPYVTSSTNKIGLLNNYIVPMTDTVLYNDCNNRYLYGIAETAKTEDVIFIGKSDVKFSIHNDTIETITDVAPDYVESRYNSYVQDKSDIAKLIVSKIYKDITKPLPFDGSIKLSDAVITAMDRLCVPPKFTLLISKRIYCKKIDKYFDVQIVEADYKSEDKVCDLIYLHNPYNAPKELPLRNELPNFTVDYIYVIEYSRYANGGAKNIKDRIPADMLIKGLCKHFKKSNNIDTIIKAIATENSIQITNYRLVPSQIAI